MLRVSAILIAALAATVSAAPLPPPSDKEILATCWGKAEGEGEFVINGKQLTIRTLGKPINSWFPRGNTTRPCVTRPVQGDFQVTLKMLDVSSPHKDVKHNDSYPATRAGLYIEGGGNCIELHLYQYYSKFQGAVANNLTRTLWVDTWHPQGGSGSSLRQVEGCKSIYLRIIRKGNKVSITHSLDGVEWSKQHALQQDLALPDTMNVGVFFSQTTYQILDATFDNIVIEKLK